MNSSSSLPNQTIESIDFESVFNYIGGLEILLGGFGNVMSVVVICSRKKLRSLATFVFTGGMAVSSTFVLLTIALMKLVNQFFQLHLELKTAWWCKICTLITFFPYQWISWLILCYNLELIISARWYNFRQRLSSPGRSLLLAIGLGLLAFALNSPALTIESVDLSGNNNAANTTVTWIDTHFLGLTCSRTFRIDESAAYFIIVRV